jgi:NADPH:quinone reductase-like Zn-dependent oxidoreductase
VAVRAVVLTGFAGPVIDFDLRRLYLYNLRLIGSSMYTRRHFAALVEVARAGGVRPRIAASYDLADLPRAQRQFVVRGHIGKIVITP